MAGFARSSSINILKAINRAGIGVLGAFLYGSDWDNRKKMMERADFVAKDRVDIMHQMILTPIPGSRMFNTMKIVRNDGLR